MLKFSEVMDKSIVSCFLTHSVVLAFTLKRKA